MRRPIPVAVTLSAAIIVSALIAGPQIAALASPTDVVAAPTAVSGVAVFEASQREERDDLPNEVDMTFATMMIPHHEQAVELARILASTEGIDRTSIALAAFIERDQSAEILQMQDWLAAWHSAGVLDHEHSGTMAGMATPEQIEALQASSGVAAEKLFLELMIAHHRGALEMTREVIVDGANSWTIALAKHIAAEQQREIEAMTTRLSIL